MESLVAVLFLLVFARACGQLGQRIGQPPSVGELLAGVLIGAALAQAGGLLPGVLPPGALRLSELPAVRELADLGIFFLVLLAGIEMEPQEIAKSSLVGLAVAAGGVLLPLVAGFALVWWLLPVSELRLVQAFAIAVVLSITAVPVVVKVFADLGLLHSRVSETVITAAIFDDVIGLLLLALLTAFIETGELLTAGALLLLLGKIAVFFGITILLGVHVYPHLHRRLKLVQLAAVEFSALICAALAYGALAHALGMHWIMGGFMAGLFFEQSRVGPQAYMSMKLIVAAVTSGVLGPLFFVSIGLQVDLGAFLGAPLFILALTLLAFFAKAIGAGLPALLSGLAPRESAAVGIAMTARGAVGLVVLSVVEKAGVFTPPPGADGLVAELFSSAVVMVVLTTILMPVVLIRVWPRARAERSGEPSGS